MTREPSYVVAFQAYCDALEAGHDHNAALRIAKDRHGYKDRNSAGRAIRKARQWYDNQRARRREHLSTDEKAILFDIGESQRAAQQRSGERLPDIEFDDSDLLSEYVDGLRQRSGWARVLYITDQHFLAINPQAWALTVQIARAAQPDLTLYGGDTADLAELGSYGLELRQTTEGALEFLGDAIARCDHDIERATGKPQARFSGNHDGTTTKGRVGRFIREGMKELGEREFKRRYVGIMRSHGLTWWVDEAQEVKLHSVIFQHGKRTGENAAKNALKDLGFGVSTAQGHNHTPGLYVMRQEVPGDAQDYRVVMSASNGTLGRLVPHYKPDTEQTKHLHASQVWDVSLDTWVANGQLIVYHRAPNDDLIAWYGGAKLVQPLTVDATREAAA